MASPAHAQFAFEGGTDVGFGIVTPDPDFVEPGVVRDNAVPTLALGIDVAAYYLFDDEIGLGFAIAPALVVGGHNPQSAGINFALAPRVMWHPGPVRFTFDAGAVLSAWNDLCTVDSEPPWECDPIRSYVPAAIGFGTSASMMFQVADLGYGGSIEVGPVARFHYARFDYDDDRGGSFGLPVFQTALAIRLNLDAPPEKSE